MDYEPQFRFMSGKSNKSAKTELMNFFYSALDIKEFSVGIFIDYSKSLI